MGKFGWDLPPGCSINDLPGSQPDPPCEICGNDIDGCVCPECPVCGGVGDPKCYQEHGLVKTQEQIETLFSHQNEWGYKKMDDFKERLKKEYTELSDKVNKLGAFLETEPYYSLSDEQQTLLRIQLITMETYLQILYRRKQLIDK